MTTARKRLLTDMNFAGDFVVIDGDVSTVSDVKNLRNIIERHIITEKNSIIHRPGFGVGLKSFQNKLTSIANQADLSSRIRDSLSRDSRITDVKSVSFRIDGSKVLISVTVYIDGLEPITESFEYNP